MEFARDWAGLILSLIAIATTVWNVFTSSAKRAHERLDKMAEDRTMAAEATITRFQTAEARILQLEADFKHIPARAQVHNIELSLEKLNGEFRVLAERLEPVAAIAHRLQELEFEKASGK
jgi:hypothetical protein